MKKILVSLIAIIAIMALMGISNKNKKDSRYHLVLHLNQKGPIGIVKNTDRDLKISLNTSSVSPVKVVKRKQYVVYGKSNLEIEKEQAEKKAKNRIALASAVTVQPQPQVCKVSWSGSFDPL